ncbi:MAG: TetR/AcrR family transcriptional regulator [Prolixibacteraceae bacterium]|nr:TetR/AcrR family transcriptional regulator [Prolixibacteraceae bacterium]
MDNTKEFIIDKAFELFLNHSYEAVSISEISKAIELTKGALYHHFRNKEELFMAVVDKYLIIEELDINTNNISLIQFIELCVVKAQDIVSKTVGSSRSFIPLNLLSFFIDAFRHYPDFSAKKNDLINSEINKTKKILDQAIVNGEIRSDINTSVTAEMFFTLNTGIAKNLIHGNMNQKLAIDKLREQLLEFYKLLKI